jgi:ribosomal-protein-alanine N-acetyltransferase
MSEPRIEPVLLSDLDALLAIEEASFPDPWSAELLKGELELRKSRRYTKAVVDGRLVAYLGLMFVDEDVHVNTLATLPEHEGRGVATRLLLEGIEASIERGGVNLTLEVAAGNERAQALYRRFGLAPVGVRRRYYANGEDALVMWGRELDSEDERARRQLIGDSLGTGS